MRFFKYALLLALPFIFLTGFGPNDSTPPQNGKVYVFFYGTTTCHNSSHFFVSQIVHETPANMDTEQKNFERKVKMKYPQYTIKAGCEMIKAKKSPEFFSKGDCAKQRNKTLYEGRKSSGSAHEITW